MNNEKTYPSRAHWQFLAVVTGIASLNFGLTLRAADDQTNGVVVASAPTTPEQPVLLSAFDVSAAGVGPYQVAETTSGTRVSENLYDSTQSIFVVTSALINDMGALGPLSAAEFLPGIAPSTGGTSTYERITVRGFQTQGVSIDGFSVQYPAQFPEDTAMVDSIESITGPNAILNPNGQPGGTVNLVTKKPQFSNFGDVRLDLGEYATNRAFIDYNRLINNDLAIRVLYSISRNAGNAGTWQDQLDGLIRRNTFMIGAKWKIGRSSELLLQFVDSIFDSDEMSAFPVNPNDGTLSAGADILPGLNRNSILFTGSQVAAFPGSNGRAGWSMSDVKTYTAEFTTRVNDHFSMRLAGNLHITHLGDTPAYNEGPFYFLDVNAGGAYNPRTGDWTPGFTYGPGPTYTPIAVPTYTPGNFQVSTVALFMGQRSVDYSLQNDYAYTFQTRWFDSLTSAGLNLDAYNSDQSNWAFQSATTTPSPFNIYTASSLKFSYNVIPNSYWHNQATGAVQGAYLKERLKFLGDKLIVEGSLVGSEQYQRYVLSGYKSGAYNNRIDPLLLNYGLVFRPIPAAELYYSHSANALLINQTPPAPPAPNPSQQAGRQDEIGGRTKFLQDRITATVAYYQIHQSNFSLLNPANYAIPIPVPALPNLLSDRIGRGWEYSINYTAGNGFDFIGSYTNFRNRNNFDIPYRGTPEQSGAFWGHYTVQGGEAKGLAFGLGWVHVGKRPGDTATGLSPLSTPTDLIPYQPSFYLPAYSVVNATATYRINKQWQVGAYIDNLLNEKYLSASYFRSWVEVGTPINPRLSVDYSF